MLNVENLVLFLPQIGIKERNYSIHINRVDLLISLPYTTILNSTASALLPNIGDELMTQVISIIGSIIILSAYGAGQAKLMSTSSLLYAVLNLIGSGILAVIAVIESQWGFLLVEGVWSLISLASVVNILRTRKPSAAQ